MPGGGDPKAPVRQGDLCAKPQDVVLAGQQTLRLRPLPVGTARAESGGRGTGRPVWLQEGDGQTRRPRPPHTDRQTDRQISWGVRMTARTAAQLLREPRSFRTFPGGATTGPGLPVRFTLGSPERAPSCTPGHVAAGTDRCSGLPGTPPHPASPCSHLTPHVWPLRDGGWSGPCRERDSRRPWGASACRPRAAAASSPSPRPAGPSAGSKTLWKEVGRRLVTCDSRSLPLAAPAPVLVKRANRWPTTQREDEHLASLVLHKLWAQEGLGSNSRSNPTHTRILGQFPDLAKPRYVPSVKRGEPQASHACCQDSVGDGSPQRGGWRGVTSTSPVTRPPGFKSGLRHFLAASVSLSAKMEQ